MTFVHSKKGHCCQNNKEEGRRLQKDITILYRPLNVQGAAIKF
ncbi:MAG: hypothetical protein WBF33_33585 [Candidatus Nitrosopolaris sp.]